MLDKLFERKKTRGRNLILILLPFIVILGLLIFLAVRTISSVVSTDPQDKEVYVIESMDYKLRSNATEYQVDLFNELADAVNNGEDNLRIAQLVCENYVADFYTFTNKYGSYDVGGAYFIYSPYKPAIIVNARRSFYKYLTYYINEFGSETLPEVTSVSVVESTVNGSPYSLPYEKKDVESYYVCLEWTYNDYTYNLDNDALQVWNKEWVKGYTKKGYFTVVKNPNTNRFEIVEAWGDD